MGGGESASYSFEDDASDSTLFLRYLWRHAELYGLKRQPVATSHRPMMSGTITAKQLVEFEPRTAVEHAGGGFTAVGVGGVPNGIGAEAGAADRTATEVPACTFVLTTQDGVEIMPKHESYGSESPSSSSSKGGVAGSKTLDVLLFIIASTRSTSCYSSGCGARSSVGRSTALRMGVPLHDEGARPAYEASGRARSGPRSKEVAEQTKILVERLLRLALAHRRKDRVWWLFNNAMMTLSRKKTPPHQAPTTTCTLAAAGSSKTPDCLPRAPSPASPHPGFDFRGGGRKTPRHDPDDNPSPVCESDLRHLLEISTVTSLGVADPALSGFLDHKHGVDWSGWFQHLVDSPHILTLVFEDGDDPAPVSSSSSAPTVVNDAPADATESAAASATTASTRICVDGLGDASDAKGNDCGRGGTRRVLLALPRSDGQGVRDGAAAAQSGDGNLAAFTKEDGGEGPWVGAVGGGSGGASPASSDPSIFFNVALDKVSNGYFSTRKQNTSLLQSVMSPSQECCAKTVYMVAVTLVKKVLAM